MAESGYQFGSSLYESTNFFSTSYRSPDHSSIDHGVVNPADLALPSTQSPESSSDSSSSNSTSNQHKRNNSSDSSRSGAPNGDVDGKATGKTSVSNGILIGASPTEARLSEDYIPLTDYEKSNRAMERHFDFDSAASSPNPHPGTHTRPLLGSSTFTSKVFPLRSNPNHGFDSDLDPSLETLENSQEASYLSSTTQNASNWSQRLGNGPQSPSHSARTYVSGRSINRQSQNHNWPYNMISGDPAPAHSTTTTMFRPQAVDMPFASPTVASVPTHYPTLYVRPLPAKSRVETQILVKLALHPMPPGISRLHLQTHTISKIKHISNPTPEKSPDMLELHAMVVCSSAMQDHEKRGRAFARAASIQSNAINDGSSSSPCEHQSSMDDERKPVNGGPVRICSGCIERERKRAQRKKTKNTEEEHLWLRDELKRIIVFNCAEVVEWSNPSSTDTSDYPQNLVGFGDTGFPEDAPHVEIPMRIACYCRHQDEKAGFQVIFTLRDHQNNVVTQTMTSSIVITDDHKTHPMPSVTHPQATVFPEGAVVPGAGVFPQAPTLIHGSTSFGHSFSTTDLQGMQQQHNLLQMNPFAPLPSAPQTISANVTPRAISRPGSPTPLGPQSKRRKGSNPGRIRHDLKMTKLQTSNPSSVPNQGIACSAGSFIGLAPGGFSAFVPNHASSHSASGQPTPPIPTQYSTNPPTPNVADNAFFPSAQRSQSMDNLQGLQGIYSTPDSMRASRVPSPTPGHQNNGLPQGHAQLLTNSLYSASGAVNPQRSPVIHKLTPAEGPKAGGIEVTCLGSGFRQGLEVMFGDAQATTTTFWGESALVCLVPPAVQAGTVLVTFKQCYEQSAASPSNKLAVFKYIDDDEQMLMKHALALVNRKWNGSSTDAGDSARNIINFLGASSSFLGGSNQNNNQQRYTSGNTTRMGTTVDLQAAILSCLNLVDLDDSPFKVSFNAQGSNGQSMLHLSASLGYYRLTAGLLARGANPDIRDKNGMSPMHLASLRGHHQIIRKLRSAGADPTLRSLNGFTPAEMATSQQAHDASNTFDHRRRSRSAGATPASHLSRASSVVSFKSSNGANSRVLPNVFNDELEDRNAGDEASVGACRSRPLTPNEVSVHSRRNSMVTKQEYLADESRDELAPNASISAANPAVSALRDQLSAQIQQLQQSVHKTLPALQMPAFPPIPTLPDYQAYPIVGRISSLVPQRHSRPDAANSSSKAGKDADYHWWELLMGGPSSPPAYEEIYPENAQRDVDDRKASALRAAGEAFIGRKCEANFDHAEGSSSMDAVNLGSSIMTKSQREQLRAAHATKVKKLKSDRKLFLIWIPLLILVLIAMLKDRAPQTFRGVYQAFQFARERVEGRWAEVV